MRKELQDSANSTFSELRDMTSCLEMQLKSKQRECENLIDYQEEFRLEYIGVCKDRDDYQRRFELANGQVDYLNGELRDRNKEAYDFKEKMRTMLEIVEGPHCHDVIPQHVEMVMDINRT